MTRTKCRLMNVFGGADERLVGVHKSPAGESGFTTGKVPRFRHSERSEESLFRRSKVTRFIAETIASRSIRLASERSIPSASWSAQSCDSPALHFFPRCTPGYIDCADLPRSPNIFCPAFLFSKLRTVFRPWLSKFAAEFSFRQAALPVDIFLRAARLPAGPLQIRREARFLRHP